VQAVIFVPAWETEPVPSPWTEDEKRVLQFERKPVEANCAMTADILTTVDYARSEIRDATGIDRLLAPGGIGREALLEAIEIDTRARETRTSRFWRALGFHSAFADRPADLAGFVSGFACSDLTFRLSLLDRLRLLVSGRISVQVLHQMDAMPKRWQSNAAYGVLPPNGGI
jgi:hypothetical protein